MIKILCSTPLSSGGFSPSQKDYIYSNFFYLPFQNTHAHADTLFLISIKSTLLAKYPQSVLPLLCPGRIFLTPKTRWGGDEAVEAWAPLIQSRPAKLPYGQVYWIHVHFKCLLMICYCWVQVVSICLKVWILLKCSKESI